MRYRTTICVVLGIILVLSSVNVVGENAEKKYSYSMQLSYSDGDMLPPAPITISDIYRKRLHLQVNNYIAKSDRFMLLCFLDGKMIPYEIEGLQNVNQQFDIESAGQREIDFTPIINPEKIHSGSILYIVTVGLLDKVPKNIMDNYELFSCGIAIIIDENTLEENQVKIDNKLWNKLTINEADAESDMDVYYVDGMYDNIASMGKAVVYGDQEGYDLNIIAKGDNQSIALWLFVDNQPYLFSEGTPLIVYAEKGNLYKHTTNLKLSEGQHSVYYVYMSLDPDKTLIWNTNKLSITIGQ